MGAERPSPEVLRQERFAAVIGNPGFPADREPLCGQVLEWAWVVWQRELERRARQAILLPPGSLLEE